MGVENLVGMGVAFVLSAAVVGVANWRLRCGRGRLAPVDGFAGLAVLVWASVAATSAIAWVGTGDAAAVASPPLLVAVAGSALGGLTAAGFAIARGSMADLGMDRLAPRWVALGALTVPAFLLVGAGWVALLEMLGVEVQQQELLDVAGAGALRPADWAALAYGAVGAPLVEEVVFRGLVFSALARAGGEARAAVGSGVMFGLLHVAEPAAVGPLVVMGIVLGFLRARSGSLAPAVALHLGNNVLAMGLVLAGVVRG